MFLKIIVILLVIGIFALGLLFLIMWKRISQVSAPQTPAAKPELPKKLTGISEPAITREAQLQVAGSMPTVKGKMIKPKVPPNARIENLTELYTSVPGILGAIITDRVGQTIAANSNLVIDKVAIPAYFIEIFALLKNERLPLGRLKSLIVHGEGSYWVFGTMGGMLFGVWLESEMNIHDGIALNEDFREDIIRVFKSSYSKIW